jgi:ribosome-binding factor A
MGSRRLERINELLKEEISDLIANELKDPRLSGLVSVTEVETTPGLEYARVYVSVLGDAAQREQTLGALQHASGFFRRLLGERVKLRQIPELTFRFDDSIERGDRIMRLLREAAP